MNEKIAILTDSGSDVPMSEIEKYSIYQLSLGINYKNKSYKDRVDISPEAVYENLSVEIPKTSLPSVGEIRECIQKIADDGYDAIIIPVISSGLSGTYQAVELVCKDFPNLKTVVIDTKNIGIASGFFSIYAAHLRENGLTFDQITEKLKAKIDKSFVYFSLQTLQYLIKGGRIGRVEGMFGSLLQIKPIISCDANGIYYTVEKVRGRKQSLKRIVELLEEQLKGKTNYYLSVCHGYAQEEADQISDILKPYIERAAFYTEGQISPALGVHTGPGLVGIGFFELDDSDFVQ